MSETLLLLTRASFGYGLTSVVSDVDLSIREGEIVGLIGPNGGGKSTLLRGAIGLLSPLEGQVKRNAQRLGYVPQRDALDPLYPWTVREVVAQGAYARLRSPFGRLHPSDREEAAACLDRVGLLTRANDLFSSLSGGQRQRTLLARALLMHPDLIALDEPTSGVDVEAKRQIFDLLEELRTDGLAILLVSHDLDLVAERADQIIRVGEGRAVPAARGIHS